MLTKMALSVFLTQAADKKIPFEATSSKKTYNVMTFLFTIDTQIHKNTNIVVH